MFLFTAGHTSLSITLGLCLNLTEVKAAPTPVKLQSVTAEKNGVLVVVHLPKQGIVGQPFIMTVETTNHSHEPVYYHASNSTPSYPDFQVKVWDKSNVEGSIEVPNKQDATVPRRQVFQLGAPSFRDSQGVIVPLTRFGETILSFSSEVAGLYATAPLAVGQRRSDSLNLSRFYDLSLAGNYQVSVSVLMNPLGPRGILIDLPFISWTLTDPLDK